MRKYKRRGKYRGGGIDWSDKEARAKYQREWQKANKQAPAAREMKVKPATLICHACEAEKPFTEEFFYANHHTTFGLHKQCKVCEKRKSTAKRWGVSAEVYHAYVRNGSCHICGGRASQMSIDHCHTTGKARGVLCRGCNTGLGCFKDNPALLEAAASYLRIPR